MSAESAEEIQKHMKLYLGVFYTLMVLTVVTWAASFLPVGMAIAVMIAMLIAVVKSSLVIGFFMHMIGEKKVIMWAMLLCLTFFAVLMAVPVLVSQDTAGHSVAPAIVATHAEAEGADAEGEEAH